MTTEELESLLRKHLGPDQWALFFSVSNATGYRKCRSADAIAMGLWPSAGMEVHGFELKVSRGDWLRELKQPDKSTEIARYCDRWWLVVGDAAIVKDGELPAGWGLLAPKVLHWAGRNGEDVTTLDEVQEAPLRVSQPLDRGFIASMLRSAQKTRDAA